MSGVSPKIRRITPGEYRLLREFLYQAIYLPQGVDPPPRSVVDLPELQVYLADFGTQPGDYCLVADLGGRVIGAVWSRIMEDYGHLGDGIPSLAISLLPEYRGRGIGTQLLHRLLALLRENGFSRVSLSVQKENPALRLYLRAGFRIAAHRGNEYLMLWELEHEKRQRILDARATK